MGIAARDVELKGDRGCTVFQGSRTDIRILRQAEQDWFARCPLGYAHNHGVVGIEN